MRTVNYFRFDLLFVLLICRMAVATPFDAAVDFNRQIRPILAARCFACHGPDESTREAELRLDRRDAVLASGMLDPGAADDSEVLRRIESSDHDDRMPPPEAGAPLTENQQTLIRRWIEQGANYDAHWAFVAPRRPSLPNVQRTSWPINEIDYFILAKLETEGWEPSPRADPYTLVRRLYLDLIGLPPTPHQADTFVRNRDANAYEQLVDRLLESRHYGERWARQWLDLARYADTNGYEKDRERSIWPYRDWVIRALNQDMPFDQFTVEQLAGDMLPDPTMDQLIATGFHRNTMLNEEGGIDPLEYRFYAIVDRVATTGTVWLGLTTGCAQCHTHKYDPITHTDYYRFMALLNNADEPDLVLREPRIDRRRSDIRQQIEVLTKKLADRFPPDAGSDPIEVRRLRHLKTKFEAWLAKSQAGAAKWQILTMSSYQTNLPKLESLDDGSIFSTGDVTKRDVFTLRFPITQQMLPITALRLEAMPDDRLPAGGPGRAYYEGRKGDFFLSELALGFGGEPVNLTAATRSYGKIAIGSGDGEAANVLDGNGSTGWSTAGREGETHQWVANLTEPITTTGELQIEMLFERHFVASLGRFRWSAASESRNIVAKTMPVELESVLARDRSTWTRDEIDRLRLHYLTVAPELAEARASIEELRKNQPSYPHTLVMQERAKDNPRPTFRHHRGEYLSPKEQVAPGIPAFLSDETLPANRLELAEWLASAENPLIGRVVANRAWQAFFGYGLVRSNGDFGTQSDPPTHPALLDWLASEFIGEGSKGRRWSLKQLHKRIVMSATYRQSSRLDSELARRDPNNELLARGPRHRVNAETVRDIMLQASGLLSTKMYGPSQRPPQPASVTAVAYGGGHWPVATGEDRYRRSLYTFIKRTAPFAAYTIFDAPSGENCVARRNRSNTPLQALTLLNDEMYLEMARALSQSVLSRRGATAEPAHEKTSAIADESLDESLDGPSDGPSDVAIATTMFRRLLTRPPDTEEIAAIVQYKTNQLQRIDAGQIDAAKIMKQDKVNAESAAWAMTARVLMNLDEAITKQ